MKSKYVIGLFAVCILTGIAMGVVTKTFSYVCMNPNCKSYKQVFTFSENEPNEHHCQSCGQRLNKQ